MANFFKNVFLLCSSLLLVSTLYAQERIISGNVTTLEKIAVINAEIKVSSNKVTVLTDSTGYFSVSCLPKDKIRISARGFLPKKIKLDEKTKQVPVNLKFKPGEKNVDIAIGYGHIKEEEKSFAITNINDRDQLKFTKYANIIDYIVDTSPSIGLRNGGIIIRGESSANGSNSALIILNGSETSLSQLSEINPLNVKSVDILKGSSAATYGIRGANGVILVATKN